MKKVDKELVGFILKLILTIWEFLLKKIIRPKTTIEKYLFYSLFRKKFNDVYFSEVDITYTFKDGDCPTAFGMDIEYNYKGYALSKSLSELLLYLSMRTYNKANISITAFDRGVNVGTTISTKHNGKKAYGDNGAYWEILFHGNELSHMSPIDSTLKISWKNFCPYGEIDTLIIDPRNYAKKNKIDKINITIKNYSKNCEIGSIKLREYNRKNFKYTNKADLYNKGNTLPEPNTLVKHEITRESFDENKVFVLKCERA